MPIEYATESENIIMQIFGSEKERIISFIPKEDNYNLELHIFKSLEKLEEIHKHKERAEEFFVEIAKEFIVKSLDKYLKGDLNNEEIEVCAEVLAMLTCLNASFLLSKPFIITT